MEKPSVLIVEDHQDFRRAVCDYLNDSGLGLDVHEAASGEEGVVLAHKLKPRVVLMDFWLGGINGVEAANQIKQDDPKCFIIMLSMIDKAVIIQQDRKKTIHSFINKSELTDHLIVQMQRILSRN